MKKNYLKKTSFALMICAGATVANANQIYLNCSGKTLVSLHSLPWEAAAQLDTDHRRATVDDIDLVIVRESQTYFNLRGSTELSSVEGWINRIDGSLWLAFSDHARSRITASCRTADRLF